MSGLLIGYARVSTDAQDLTAQRHALAALRVGADRIHVDHGLTGRNRDRPGLRQALAACSGRRHPAVARAQGRLCGKQPKLKPRQEARWSSCAEPAGHTVSELEELFGVSRSTGCRAVERAGGRAVPASPL